MCRQIDGSMHGEAIILLRDQWESKFCAHALYIYIYTLKCMHIYIFNIYIYVYVSNKNNIIVNMFIINATSATHNSEYCLLQSLYLIASSSNIYIGRLQKEIYIHWIFNIEEIRISKLLS